IRTTDPPDTELSGPIASLTNTLAGTVEYRLTDRFSVGFAPSWLHVSFLDNQEAAQDLDRNEYILGGSVFWKGRPKLDLEFAAGYDRKVFILSEDRNVNDYSVLVGLRGYITPKLSSTFRIGYLIRVPDTDSQPGYNGLIVAGGLTYAPTERTTISLLVERIPQ